MSVVGNEAGQGRPASGRRFERRQGGHSEIKRAARNNSIIFGILVAYTYICAPQPDETVCYSWPAILTSCHQVRTKATRREKHMMPSGRTVRKSAD